MIVAEEKRKENIIEYILYMWQIEDMLRACNLDYEEVEQKIISGYDQPDEVMEEIRQWYRSHLDMLKREGKQSKGHLAYLETMVKDLQQFHTKLLNVNRDKEYQSLYSEALKAIEPLKARAGSPLSEVELCMNGLYGYLLLKLQNKSISEETRDGVNQITAMLRFLAEKFRDTESGLEEI
jgi:hypothetical protein